MNRNENCEHHDAYCIDCDTVTTQTVRCYFRDGIKFFEKTTCDRCGCENDSEIKPLTLDELYECDGLPVWTVLLDNTIGILEGWSIVYRNNGSAAMQRWTNCTLWYQYYGEEWIAFKKQLVV